MKPLICADCRWDIPKSGTHFCKASERPNLVTGAPEYQYCSVMRLHREACGPEGKLFELNQADEGEQHGE